MKQILVKTAVAFLAILCLSSCEKPIIEELEPSELPESGIQVKFNITHFDMIPFQEALNISRATTDASQICTHINVAVFSGNTKVKAINQDKDDNQFGTISFRLEKGTYTIVILAHSCQGDATITSANEIKFPNNKITDTFYYYGEIDVMENQSYDITLNRAVSKFLLAIEDNMPENVKDVTFKYTGGSSTFDATIGLGCVNSRQTETREVTSDMAGKPTEFEIYTFPHAETDELKITVTASDASQNTVREKVFDNVPVRINQITRYSGHFFDENPIENNASDFHLTTNDEWNQIDYTY